MCTLANVFESSGISTIVITPLREIAERMKVPRALYTNFPLGLSLGKPNDREFQHSVLKAAFELLTETKVPVIADFPIIIDAADSEPISCSLPPRMNPDLHPAVDEAEGLKSAYDRAYQKNKKTSVGMEIDAAKIPQALEKFVKIIGGQHWEEVGFSAKSMYCIVHDIRSYYEELSIEIAQGPIGAWSTEEWFYEKTQAGQLILQARRVMRDKDIPQSVWFGLAPAGRD